MVPPPVRLQFHGNARLELALRVRTQRIAQLGYHRYNEHLLACAGTDKSQAIAKALPLVRVMTDAETWLTALSVLAYWFAIPDPLVVELPPSVQALPVE